MWENRRRHGGFLNSLASRACDVIDKLTAERDRAYEDVAKARAEREAYRRMLAKERLRSQLWRGLTESVLNDHGLSWQFPVYEEKVDETVQRRAAEIEKE